MGWLGSAAVNTARSIASKARLANEYRYRLVGRIVEIHEQSMTVEVCLSVGNNYTVRFDMIKTRYPQTVEEYNNGDTVPVLEDDPDKVFIEKLYSGSTFHTKLS